MIDRTLSYTFKTLRFPLTLLVILIHSATPAHLDNVFVDFTYVFLKGTLSRIAVPTFFIISGYLFFNRLRCWDTETYVDKLRRRTGSLLVPYLLWNLLPLTLAVAGTLLSGAVHTRNPLPDIAAIIGEVNWVHTLWGNGETASFLRLDWGTPADLPMWYVRDLMLLVLLSPLIHWPTRRWGACFVLPFVILFGIVCRYGALTSAVYYTIGAYFAISGRPLVPVSRAVRIAVHSVTAMIMCACLTAVYWVPAEGIRQPLDAMFTVVGPLSVICGTYSLRSRGAFKVPRLWSECSFFVFALHIFYMIRFARQILDVFIPGDAAAAIITRYILAPFVTYGLCMLLYVVLKRFCPAVLRLYSGNRIMA